MSVMSTLHRPLSPATPAHTPHGSVGSIRSRTPGQLSLHEYRRQQANTSPLSEEGGHRLKKKVAVLNLHHAPQGIPTAPPTPQEVNFEDLSEIASEKAFGQFEGREGNDDENEDAIIEANILKYTVGRAKKGYVRSRESASRHLSFPRGHHHDLSVTSSTSSHLHPRSVLNSLSNIAHHDVAEAEAEAEAEVVSSHHTPPQNVESQLLRHKSKIPQTLDASHQSVIDISKLFEPSLLEFVVGQATTTHDPMDITKLKQASTVPGDGRPPKLKYFKAIKRLPRPREPSIDPVQLRPESDDERSSNSPFTSASNNSPFTLSNYQFPAVPVHTQSALRKSQSYDDADKRTSERESMPEANLSFSDLLYLYSADIERTSENDSTSMSKASHLQSEQSLQALRQSGIAAIKHTLPKMTSFTNDPYDSRPMSLGITHRKGNEPNYPFNRESSYTENWDSRSIIDADENVPPGRALGIVDYADVGMRNAQHDSYTPINTIFDQYGRYSTESTTHRPHRTVGRPPHSPPPPVPALPIPRLDLPHEEDTIDHTTDYGMTRDLLRDQSSTPFELPRSNRSPPNQSHIQLQEPSSIYDTSASPMPAFGGDPETVSIALSTLSEDWQTIANTSTNELTGNFSSMADYAFSPFPTHFMPPLHTNQQRRAITYDEIPEVPSPQSTLPELDAFHYGQDLSSQPPDDMEQSDYSADMRSIPDTPNHDSSSLMRYSLHDGADTVDAFSDRSSATAEPRPAIEGKNYNSISPIIVGEHPPVGMTKQDEVVAKGFVDLDLLSSEPNDAIDAASIDPDPPSKRRSTLSSMFLGRGSKRSSRNFSNQRNPIELQLPKRTSSLRATELQHQSDRRVTQLANCNIQQISVPTDALRNIHRPAKLQKTHTKDSQTPVDHNLDPPQPTPSMLSPYSSRRGVFHTRPASSAASTEPLIHDTGHRQTVLRQALPSLGNQETGGLRQLYLAEEGAYTNTSNGAKDCMPAITLSISGYQEQLRRSRLWFAIFLPFPFFLILYSFGVMDRLAGPRGMLKHYKTWARYVVFVEIVLVLIALTVWGVARRGS